MQMSTHVHVRRQKMAVTEEAKVSGSNDCLELRTRLLCACEW